MKWERKEVRGEKEEKERQGGRGERGNLDNAIVQKIPCVLSISNENINLCIFKFLGVRSKAAEQINWMLLKLDEIFMLI